MDSCTAIDDDATRLSDRVASFLSDRSTDSVLGPRRFGRGFLVDFVVDAARSMGLSVWTEDGPVDRPDTMVFRHWSSMDVYRDAIDSNPGADILFGQDLCHQVPAVVRLRK